MMELPSLRTVRQRKAMSQRDLAGRAGIGLSTVIRLERGGTATELTIQRLASALDVPPEALRWLDVLMRSTMAEVVELEMPSRALVDCFDVMRAFVAYHLPARLKALDFYAGIVRALPQT